MVEKSGYLCPPSGNNFLYLETRIALIALGLSSGDVGLSPSESPNLGKVSLCALPSPGKALLHLHTPGREDQQHQKKSCSISLKFPMGNKQTNWENPGC